MLTIKLYNACSVKEVAGEDYCELQPTERDGQTQWSWTQKELLDGEIPMESTTEYPLGESGFVKSVSDIIQSGQTVAFIHQRYIHLLNHLLGKNPRIAKVDLSLLGELKIVDQ